MTATKGCPWGLDLRYFWMNDFNDRFSTMAVDPFLGAADLNLSFESALQGAEINATYQVTDWLSVLWGFRWLQVNELVAVNVDIAAFPDLDTSLALGTTNNLWGGQVGANVALLDLESFRLNLLTKLGIYQNEHAINYDVTFFGLGPFHLHTSDSDAAFSTDARLGGTWWLTPNLSVTAGYQVLLIDGLLRGETPIISGVALTDLKANDTLVYHGGYFGVTLMR